MYALDFSLLLLMVEVVGAGVATTRRIGSETSIVGCFLAGSGGGEGSEDFELGADEEEGITGAETRFFLEGGNVSGSGSGFRIFVFNFGSA